MWITSTCSVLSGKFLADSNKWWFYVLFLKLQWPFIFLWIFLSVIVRTLGFGWETIFSQSVCLPSASGKRLLPDASSSSFFSYWVVFFPPPDNLSPYLGFRFKKKKSSVAPSILCSLLGYPPDVSAEKRLLLRQVYPTCLTLSQFCYRHPFALAVIDSVHKTQLSEL